jgi:hypothetical protein
LHAGKKRSFEIQSWLNEHRDDVDSFVILDDDAEGIRPRFDTQFVHCNQIFSSFLLYQHAKKILQIPWQQKQFNATEETLFEKDTIDSLITALTEFTTLDESDVRKKMLQQRPLPIMIKTYHDLGKLITHFNTYSAKENKLLIEYADFALLDKIISNDKDLNIIVNSSAHYKSNYCKWIIMSYLHTVATEENTPDFLMRFTTDTQQMLLNSVKKEKLEIYLEKADVFLKIVPYFSLTKLQETSFAPLLHKEISVTQLCHFLKNLPSNEQIRLICYLCDRYKMSMIIEQGSDLEHLLAVLSPSMQNVVQGNEIEIEITRCNIYRPKSNAEKIYFSLSVSKNQIADNKQNTTNTLFGTFASFFRTPSIQSLPTLNESVLPMNLG